MGWVQGYLALNPKSSSPTPTFPIQNIWFNDFGSVTKYISSSSSPPDAQGWLETILSRFKDAYPLTPNGTFPTLNGEWLVTGKDFGVVCMENNRAIPRVRLYGPTRYQLRRLGTAKTDKWVKWKVDEAAFNKLKTKGGIKYPGSIKDWLALNSGYAY